MDGDEEPPPERLPAKFDAGYRAHNTNVYPDRHDRCYLGYLDGGLMVLGRLGFTASMALFVDESDS